jgi:hypothetical protein
MAKATEPAHRHEARHPGEDEGLAAEEVAQLAGDRDGDCGGQQVGGGDPGVAVEPVQLGDDPRHGSADDGLVQRCEQQREHDACRDKDQLPARHRHNIGALPGDAY